MDSKQDKVFKVKASIRFLYAPTGRIYDPNDVFAVKTETDKKYLTEEHKLCVSAPDDAEITETEQDRQDKVISEAIEAEKKIKEEVKEVIKEKFPTKKELKPKKLKK